MPRRTPLSSLKQINEINLTPLMDLTFILLITFIITFPMIEQGILVNLPKAEGADITVEHATTITLEENGALYLDDLPVSLASLEKQMNQLGETSPEISVFVRADEAIRYGNVVEVLRVLRQAKLTHMALITEAEE